MYLAIRYDYAEGGTRAARLTGSAPGLSANSMLAGPAPGRPSGPDRVDKFEGNIPQVELVPSLQNANLQGNSLKTQREPARFPADNHCKTKSCDNISLSGEQGEDWPIAGNGR
jgi:hypothetical protein